MCLYSRFIVKKLEGLISKSRSGQSNDFKSLIVLILQLVKKNYSPKKLLPHYKSFIKFLKIIRNYFIYIYFIYIFNTLMNELNKGIIRSLMRFSRFGLNLALI